MARSIWVEVKVANEIRSIEIYFHFWLLLFVWQIWVFEKGLGTICFITALKVRVRSSLRSVSYAVIFILSIDSIV